MNYYDNLYKNVSFFIKKLLKISVFISFFCFFDLKLKNLACKGIFFLKGIQTKSMLLRLLKNFYGLIFPKLCHCCGISLAGSEEIICTKCLYSLPKTYFHNDADNPMEKIFRGRIPINAIAAYLYFQKGGSVQKLIHQFKYSGKHQIGFYFGKLYGNELLNSELFSNIDVIIPVPMHPAKQRKRGYNQSEIFANGISEALKKPIDKMNLVKTEKTQTQTRKSRFVRWENVETVFTIKDAKMLEGKHILIVDDVITTGATIEACCQKLLKINGVRISIVTLAIAA
jgi:ComF family protein